MDDRLRKLTDDIGRGFVEPPFCITHRAPWFEDVCDFALQYPDGRDCVWSDAPVASDAMAERDDHGEVKGVLF